MLSWHLSVPFSTFQYLSVPFSTFQYLSTILNLWLTLRFGCILFGWEFWSSRNDTGDQTAPETTNGPFSRYAIYPQFYSNARCVCVGVIILQIIPMRFHECHSDAWQFDRIKDLIEMCIRFTFRYKLPSHKDTPVKIHMEHHHRGLEDHFPFQMGDL